MLDFEVHALPNAAIEGKIWKAVQSHSNWKNENEIWCWSQSYPAKNKEIEMLKGNRILSNTIWIFAD